MAEGSRSADREKRARICISTWSFHNLFPQTRDEKAPPITERPLDVLEFPEMIADRYHVHNLEVVAPHFASTEASYLRDFKSRLERAHSRLINIPIDIDEPPEENASKQIICCRSAKLCL
jgi:hypothetical protein